MAVSQRPVVAGGRGALGRKLFGSVLCLPPKQGYVSIQKSTSGRHSPFSSYRCQWLSCAPRPKGPHHGTPCAPDSQADDSVSAPSRSRLSGRASEFIDDGRFFAGLAAGPVYETLALLGDAENGNCSRCFLFNPFGDALLAMAAVCIFRIRLAPVHPPFLLLSPQG